MSLDGSNIYDERQEVADTDGQYATGSGTNTELHYSKKNFTKKQVLDSAFKGKDKLNRKWWVLESRDGEYVLKMNPRLTEGAKPTSKKPLTYAEQKKFGVYETEESTENRRVALSMDAMLGQTPNPAFQMTGVDSEFSGRAVRDRKKDEASVRGFYGI